MESTPAQVAANALVNLSFAWTIGILACRPWLSRQPTAWERTVARHMASAMLAGLAVCTAGIFLSLWTESAIMGEVAWLDAWPVLTRMITTTHYGHASAAAMALLVVAMVAHQALYRSGARMPYTATMAGLLLLVAAARVTIGHAYEHGPFSLAAAAQWLHLLCMALWAGIVFVSGWLVLPSVLLMESGPTRSLRGRRRRSEKAAADPSAAQAPGQRAAYLNAMSHWATAALAGVLATGAYNAWRVLGSPGDLVNAAYGQVLLLKMLLVLIAIALGGYNKFLGLPASLADRDLTQSRRGLLAVVTVLRIESIVLVAVFVAAAILASSAPPGH